MSHGTKSDDGYQIITAVLFDNSGIILFERS